MLSSKFNVHADHHQGRLHELASHTATRCHTVSGAAQSFPLCFVSSFAVRVRACRYLLVVSAAQPYPPMHFRSPTRRILTFVISIPCRLRVEASRLQCEVVDIWLCTVHLLLKLCFRFSFRFELVRWPFAIAPFAYCFRTESALALLLKAAI